MPPHALKLAEPNVIDEDLIRKCITTVEEIKLSDEKKKELKMHTELHDIKVIEFLCRNEVGDFTFFMIRLFVLASNLF